MPDNPIAGLYPQPAQNNQGSILSGNPLSLIGPLMQIQQLNANRAVGQAFQGAIKPDGSGIDTGALARGLQNPAAALGAPEAVSRMLQNQGQSLANTGQGITNTTASTNLAFARQNDLQGQLSAHADDPDLSPAKVRQIVTSWAASNGVPWAIAAPTLNNVLTNPAGIKSALQSFRTAQAGAANASGRVEGPPAPSGASTKMSVGAANQAGATPTTLPPGSEAAIAAPKAAYVADNQRSAQTMAAIRPLQTALPLLEKMSASDFGPGSQGFAQVKSALMTMNIIPPNATDTEARQEANKYLHVYAGAARGADRSDQGLQQAMASNPTLDLTQGANLALVKNQIGMDRMDAALPLAYQKEHPEDPQGSGYINYKANFYQNNDPRAFRFDLMSPAERRQTIDSLGKPGSAAYNKFAQSYQVAKQTQMISPQAPSGQ